MDKIFNTHDFEVSTENALLQGLDFIAKNRIYSAWTNRKTGWQEQWEQSKFSGLYATSNALSLLSNYPERYANVIKDACEELRFVFDDKIDYTPNCNDDKNEATRKERCRFLLAQNINTTLKAVYFLRTYNELLRRGFIISNEESFKEIINSAYKQVEDSYNDLTGMFSPAKNNTTDESMLTTMQAFILMKDLWKVTPERLVNIKKNFLMWLFDYKTKAESCDFSTDTKFERYAIKRNVVIALYALSYSLDLLTEDEKTLLRDVFYLTMHDNEIRNGILIKDSYTVPETMYARDTYITDSRILYLDSFIRLLHTEMLPCSVLEYFLDDFCEIIDTIKLKSQYINWDSSPSFSHNIKGLKVLYLLLQFIKEKPVEFIATKVTPQAVNNIHRYVNPKNVVLFMPFSKVYTNSFYYSVQEILSYVGFDVWCASNDPFDTFVMDSIWNRLSCAQFVIIDCSARGANVMYEAGLSHGLGKQVLLCGLDNNAFPYETDSDFDVCFYNSNGDENPPPYRDLQKGIIEFIKKHLDEFCIDPLNKESIIKKLNEFATYYFELI